MNKGELVDMVAQKAGLTKKDVDVVIGMTLEAIIEAVSGGEKVTLVGFGTFESRDRQARAGRNPSTGAPLQIPAMTVPAFAPGNTFRKGVTAVAEAVKQDTKKAAKKKK